MEKLMLEVHGVKKEPFLIYNTNIKKYYFTIESEQFIEDITYLISSSEFFLPDCLVIASSGEMYPFGCGHVFGAHEDTIFSEEEIRELFTEHIGQNINDILNDYIGKATDEDKANLTAIQNYIHPPIETTYTQKAIKYISNLCQVKAL